MDSSYSASKPAGKSGAVVPPESGGNPDENATPEENQSVDEENSEGAEILIAKNKLPEGTKEGDTCMFKVSKDVGDEMILKYVKNDQEEQGEKTNDNLNSTTENEISALDQGGQ
jgi:hypothetical protein